MILYADSITGSIERALRETDRRREKQLAHNAEHGITPETIRKEIGDIVAMADKDRDRSGKAKGLPGERGKDAAPGAGHNLKAYIAELEEKMKAAAADLEFEEAGRIRDEIRKLEADDLGLPADEQVARPAGRAQEGRPGTRKSRYGRTTQRKMG